MQLIEVERQVHILGENVKIDDTEVKAVVNSNFKGELVYKIMARYGCSSKK